jgi:hypothetical protein
MEFTDFLPLKFILIVSAAAIYGFWQGWTGR